MDPKTPRLTLNQVVAHRLRAAREYRDWTQAEAAARLEPFLGKRWSVASFSAAEQSVTGKRAREFTADEIGAFAQAFRLPVSWFFLPPAPGAAGDLPITALAGLAFESDADRQAYAKAMAAAVAPARAPRETLLGAGLARLALEDALDRTLASLGTMAKALGRREGSGPGRRGGLLGLRGPTLLGGGPSTPERSKTPKKPTGGK